MIPPVMGSMVTFKKAHAEGTVKDYNLYISGDTLYYEELKVSHASVVVPSPVINFQTPHDTGDPS